jgi:hypothetical protein
MVKGAAENKSCVACHILKHFCLLMHAKHEIELFLCIFQGAFELGSAVCPIAIKYNKIFVDAFWNSKK